MKPLIILILTLILSVAPQHNIAYSNGHDAIALHEKDEQQMEKELLFGFHIGMTKLEALNNIEIKRFYNSDGIARLKDDFENKGYGIIRNRDLIDGYIVIYLTKDKQYVRNISIRSSQKHLSEYTEFMDVYKSLEDKVFRIYDDKVATIEYDALSELTEEESTHPQIEGPVVIAYSIFSKGFGMVSLSAVRDGEMFYYLIDVVEK